MGTMWDKEKLISTIYIAYLRVIEKTCKINYILEENNFNNAIVGFWHQDSFFMNLPIRTLKDENTKVKVVVTIDKRGNFIENVLTYFKGEALRMPDGIKMKGFLRDLKTESKKENVTLALALDGPLGPYKEPKKIAPSLSNESNKNLLGFKIEYSRKIELKKRWDKYIIPLPYTKIKVNVINFGVVTKGDCNKLKELL